MASCISFMVVLTVMLLLNSRISPPWYFPVATSHHLSVTPFSSILLHFVPSHFNSCRFMKSSGIVTVICIESWSQPILNGGTAISNPDGMFSQSPIPVLLSVNFMVLFDSFLVMFTQFIISILFSAFLKDILGSSKSGNISVIGSIGCSAGGCAFLPPLPPPPPPPPPLELLPPDGVLGIISHPVQSDLHLYPEEQLFDVPSQVSVPSITLLPHDCVVTLLTNRFIVLL